MPVIPNGSEKSFFDAIFEGDTKRMKLYDLFVARMEQAQSGLLLNFARLHPGYSYCHPGEPRDEGSASREKESTPFTSFRVTREQNPAAELKLHYAETWNVSICRAAF